MLIVRDRKSADSSPEPMSQVPVDTEFITAWKWSTDDAQRSSLKHVHWPGKKQRHHDGTASRTNVQSPRTIGRAATSTLRIVNSHGVKRSALLYEITERTKQLAQPRCEAFGGRHETSSNTRVYDEAGENESRVNSKVAKLSPRVLELSRPKVVSEKSAKTSHGRVAPGALRAVATQRILELSEPKKQPTECPPVKTRKSYLIPCSPRILSLARPKRPSVSGKGRDGPKNYRRRPRRFFTNFRRKRRKNPHKDNGSIELLDSTYNSRTTNNAARKLNTRSTNSNRSVIVIETLCKPKKLEFGSRR